MLPCPQLKAPTTISATNNLTFMIVIFYLWRKLLNQVCFYSARWRVEKRGAIGTRARGLLAAKMSSAQIGAKADPTPATTHKKLNAKV